MSRKLIIVSVVLIAVGLGLLLLSDPLLRFATRSPGTGAVFTSGGGFTGTFQGAGPGGSSSGQSAVFSRGGGATTILESVIGLGFVGAGLILEIFSLFLLPRAAKVEARGG